MSLSRILGVFFRYWYVLFRGSHSVADLFYWPFVDILLWGLTSVWIQQQQSIPQLPLILMTGLIFWQITWRGAIDIPVNLLQEFWNRNLVNLFSTPLRISEWSLGVLLLCLVKLCVTITFGATVVYFLYTLNVFEIGWAFLPFATSLLIFGWTVGFLAASAIVYWGQQVEAFAWMLGFIFAPFSGVFYPVDILPAWAQIFSWSLPTTYIFAGMRTVLMKGEFPLGYLAVSIVLNGLYLFLAFMLFRFMFEKSRAKGLARLE
jgi:ABC-2 type transport system permease protein